MRPRSAPLQQHRSTRDTPTCGHHACRRYRSVPCFAIGVSSTVPLLPAATVVPMRDGPDGLEVLMMKRNSASQYVGGVYLFPGGAVDRGDAAWAPHTHGLPDQPSGLLRGTDHEAAVAHYVAAARETLEEAGLLLAVDSAGAPAAPELAPRAREAHSTGELRAFLQLHGLRLDVSSFAYLSHWITPEGSPRRYDTRFFVGLSPADQEPSADESEVVSSRWLRPADALVGYHAKEYSMVFPTVRTLMSLAGFASSAEAMQSVRAVEHAVEQTAPRLVRFNGRIEVALPGDEAWDQGEPIDGEIQIPRSPQ